MICSQPFVVARDKRKKKILLGGLGVMGCGEMWVDEEPHHKRYAGFKKAKFNKYIESKPWKIGDKITITIRRQK